MKKNYLLMALLAFTALLSSCKKDNDDKIEDDKPNTTPEFQSTEDNNRHQREFDDLLSMSFTAMTENSDSVNKARVASDICADVTVNTTKKELVVDFGEAGCEYNGIIRKGKVILNYTKHYQDSGAIVQISLNNYRVQNSFFSQEFVKVEGVQTITNKGVMAGKKTWVVNVSDAKLIFENGDVTTWESTRTRILAEEGTASPFDEIYHIYGNASGVNRNGLAYTAAITSTDPVIFDLQCWITKRMFVGGVITVKPAGELIRSVDYGYEKIPGEACDRSVTITYGTFSFNLDL